MKIKDLAKIVGEVLNIHEDPISHEDAFLELSMKELLAIVEKCDYKPVITPVPTFQVNGFNLDLMSRVKQPQFYYCWGVLLTLSAYRLKDGEVFFSKDTIFYNDTRFRIKKIGRDGVTVFIGDVNNKDEEKSWLTVDINNIYIDENVQNDFLTGNRDRSRSFRFKIIDDRNIQRNSDGRLFSIGNIIKIENSLGVVHELAIVGFDKESVFIKSSWSEFPIVAGINSFL